MPFGTVLNSRPSRCILCLMTIRLRLTLWYTALLGLTLILFSVAVYSALAANLRFQLEQSAASQARNIAAAVAQQFQGDVLVLRSRADNLFFPQVELFALSVGAQLLDLDGAVLKRSDNLGDLPVPSHAETVPRLAAGQDHRFYYVAADGASFLVYTVPLVVNGQLMGGIQLILPVTTALTALTCCWLPSSALSWRAGPWPRSTPSPKSPMPSPARTTWATASTFATTPAK